MAARPRKIKITQVPNLYAAVDPKDNGYRFRYRNVITGNMKRLSTRNLEDAERKAQQLNAIIAQRLLDQEAKAILESDGSQSITVDRMLNLYLDTLSQRCKEGEIKSSTVDDRRWKTKALRDKYGKRKLARLTTLEINTLLKSYTSQSKHRMAQSVRSILCDFFDEAISQGHYPADKPNPARVTRAPRAKVKRARLTLDTFNKMLKWSEENQPRRTQLAALLALITAQRREDIADIRLNKLKDLDSLSQRRPSGIVTVDQAEYLALIQKKTGTKVLIPLDLRLDCIELSVRDVLNQCRDGVVSEYAIHHSHRAGRAAPGKKVRLATISQEFAKAMRGTGIDWGDNNPPTFHELRSLAEREYEKQGINTQMLLGHKHARMTEVYHDARGHDWVKVSVS